MKRVGAPRAWCGRRRWRGRETKTRQSGGQVSLLIQSLTSTTTHFHAHTHSTIDTPESLSPVLIFHVFLHSMVDNAGPHDGIAALGVSGGCLDMFPTGWLVFPSFFSFLFFPSPLHDHDLKHQEIHRQMLRIRKTAGPRRLRSTKPERLYMYIFA